MLQVQQNRYLWVQLVGLAAVPLLLDICLAGVGSSAAASGFPAAFSLQFWIMAAIGIMPGLAMQWLRPFYLFSLPPLALKPSVLHDDQRRCLTLLESWQIRALAVGTAVFSMWVLSQIYARSPQVTPVMTPTAGLISAGVTFFFACLFLQISVSAVRLILVGPQTLKRVTPYAASAIAANFSILGLRVNKILPLPPAIQPIEPANASKPPKTDAPTGITTTAKTTTETVEAEQSPDSSQSDPIENQQPPINENEDPDESKDPDESEDPEESVS